MHIDNLKLYINATIWQGASVFVKLSPDTFVLTFIHYIFTNAPMLSNKYKYCPIANVCYKLSLTPISGRLV